jgi:LPXTG-motif cell wall-anchored protein
MLLLGALALAAPAVTLASGGGGSAGDQQYTDPFAGTAPGKSKPKTTTTSTPTTSSQPATTTPATTTPAAAPTTTATPVASTATSSDPTTPTATIASTTTGELPHTGYDGWLAATLGFVLVGGGLVLRARLRRT